MSCLFFFLHISSYWRCFQCEAAVKYWQPSLPILLLPCWIYWYLEPTSSVGSTCLMRDTCIPRGWSYSNSHLCYIFNLKHLQMIPLCCWKNFAPLVTNTAHVLTLDRYWGWVITDVSVWERRSTCSLLTEDLTTLNREINAELDKSQ